MLGALSIGVAFITNPDVCPPWHQPTNRNTTLNQSAHCNHAVKSDGKRETIARRGFIHKWLGHSTLVSISNPHVDKAEMGTSCFLSDG